MYKWTKGVHWGDISKVLQRHALHWFSVCGSLFSFEWQVIRELGVKLREAMDHQEIMTVSVLRNLTLRNWETRGGQNAYKGRHVWTHAVCMQLESMCLNRFEAPSKNKTHILSFWVIPSREGKRNDISNKRNNGVEKYVCVLDCSIVSDSLRHQWIVPFSLVCPWDFPGNYTGVGSHFLLQGIFATQGPNPHLLHLLLHQADSLPLSHLKSPDKV